MRSWLFTPGDSESKLAKAAVSGADCVIIDLEDSVAEDRKAHARALLREFLASWAPAEGTPAIFVRLNGLATGQTEQDAAAAAVAGVAGVMLPKAEGGRDIERLDALLRVAEARAGLADGVLKVAAIATETAAGVLAAGSYRGASARLVALAWGAEDLAADLGATAARDDTGAFTAPFQHARTMALFGAKAAGVAALDGIVADFRDENLLRREARAALRDGFSGKLAIHPAQVPVINAAFTPSPEDVARAKEIVAAFAAAPHSGVISWNGRMLDRPHLRASQGVLARASDGTVAEHKKNR